ncbi:hypothetical protein EJB05_09955, partial [Eragrostis curvula]
MTGVAVSVTMGVMKPVLANLGVLMGDEYKKLKGLRKKVSFLERELRAINALLEKMDASDELDPQAKEWRKDIIEMSTSKTTSTTLWTTLGKPLTRWGSSEKLHRRRLGNQFQEIKTLVMEASERRMRYKLDECISNTIPVAVDPRLSALYKESESLVGINSQKEVLVKWVTDEGQQLKVLSIVGFGGLGKTTLANEVYREVGAPFNCKAFIPVSSKPDMKRLLNSMLSQLGQQCENTSHFCEMDLINSIRKSLQDKRTFPNVSTTISAMDVHLFIPSDIGYLSCLSHLVLETGYPPGLPDGIGNVKSLRSLYGFDMMKSSLENIKGLGQLANLENLLIYCDNQHPSVSWEEVMAALSSSLEKLFNLKCLVVKGTLFYNSSWVSAPFPNLEQLDVAGWLSSRVPSWIGDLHSLRELSLTVQQAGEEDVGVIGRLPSLVKFYLCIENDIPSGKMVIRGSTGLKFLKFFDFTDHGKSSLTIFEVGAMPSLIKLRLDTNNEAFVWDKGIQVRLHHLPGLRKVIVPVRPDKAKWVWDAFKKAANALHDQLLIEALPDHPKHKSILPPPPPELLEYDDETSCTIC